MVMVDTNIVIDHLRSSVRKKSLLVQLEEQDPNRVIALSMLSVQELYEGQSTRQLSREKELLLAITPMQFLPYSYEVAKLAGKIARDHSKPLELADAAIAATSIINKVPLFTLNQKHFAEIPELTLFKLT